MKASLLDSLWRVFKNENMWNSEYPKLKIKDFLLGFEYDGSLYITGLNTTYSKFRPPDYCKPNKYNMDVRCRFFYEPTMEDISIKSFSTNILYSSQGNPFQGSIFCQKTDFRNLTGEFNKYSILCLSVDLTLIPSFMNNFGNNSKFQMFIDPFEYHIIYHSERPLERSEISTLQEFELNWLQSQTESDIFLSNVKNFSQPNIISKINKINFAELVTKNVQNNQKTFEYIRNGTDCFVIMNRIVIYDLIPTIQDQQQVGARIFEKNAFIFFDILNKEQLQIYSSKLISEVKYIQMVFFIVSSVILLIIIMYQVIYAFQISKGFFRPIDQLTEILLSIQLEQMCENNLDIASLHSIQLKKHTQSQINKSPRLKFSRVNSQSINSPSKSNIRQFPQKNYLDQEKWEQNTSDLQFSSETLSLCDSFQKLFLTLRFTTQNIFGTNESSSLLNLSCQIKHFKQFKNYRALGVCFNNMANIHYNCGRYKEALENYQHSLIYGQYELQLYEQNLDILESDIDEEEQNEQKNKLQFNQYLDQKEEHRENKYDKSSGEIKQNQNIGQFLSSENNNQKDRSKDYENDKNYELCENNKKIKKYQIVHQNQQHKTLIQALNLDKKEGKHPLLNILNKNKIKTLQDLSSCLILRQQIQTTNNIKTEREILWWNIFHRRFNYSQALAGFIKDPSNKNMQLWEEMESIMYELLIISSSEYLPQCNKRDMMILYYYSNALFNQNKIQQFIECLNIYEQKFQDYKEKKQSTSSPKNAKIPKFNQNFTLITPSPCSQNFISTSQKQKSIQKIQTFYISDNTAKNSEKNSIQLKPAFNNLPDSPQSQLNQQTPIQNTIIYTPKSKFFIQTSEQIQLPCTKNQRQYSLKQKKSSSISQDPQLSYCQDQSFEYSDYKSKSIKQQHADENVLQQVNRGKSIQLHKINSIDKSNSENEQDSSLNTHPQEQQNIQSETSIDFPNKKNKEKKKFFSKQNSIKLLHLSKIQESEQTNSQQSKNIKKSSQNINDQNSKILSSTVIQNNEKFNNSDNNILSASQIQFQSNQYSQVKVISDQTKLSKYQFNLDIYAQIFSIQLSNLQIKLGNYNYSAEILTEQLERNYVYLPHLKRRILKKLSNIFIKTNIHNPQLLQMSSQYEAFQNTNFRVCMISNAHKAFAKSISLLLCKDIVSDILIKKDDQFALISFSQEDQLFDHLLSFTSKDIIMHQYFHFIRLLNETFLPQSDSSVNYFDESNIFQNQSQIKSLKKIFQKSSYQPSLNTLYKRDTYLNKQEVSSRIQEFNNIFQGKPISEEIVYFSQKSLNQLPEQNLYLNKKDNNFLNSSTHINDIQVEKTIPIINIHSDTNLDNNQSQNCTFCINSNNSRQTNIKLNFHSPLVSFTSTQQLLKEQVDQSYEIQNNQNTFNNSHYELLSPIYENKSPKQKDKKELNLNLPQNFISDDQLLQTYKESQNSTVPNTSFQLNLQNKDLKIMKQINLSSFSKIPDQSFQKNNKIPQEDKEKQQFRKDIFNKNIKKNEVIEEDLLNIKQNNQYFNKNKFNLHPQLEKISPKFASMEYLDDNPNSTYRYDSRQQINSASNIDNSKFHKKDQEQYQKQQEMVFHLGIHFALKKVLLDTEQKLTLYATFNKVQNNKQLPINAQEDQKLQSSENKKQKNYLSIQQCPPLQKTFLIYVTDQIFNISNHKLYQELCNLLENLQIELLVLIENSYQSTLEESFLSNLNFENKQTIQYFSSQTKLLQYIYNQRDIINHKLYPTIVEQFQTNFIFVFIL